MTYATQVIADSPTGYWQMNEASGAIVDTMAGVTLAGSGPMTYNVASLRGNVGIDMLGTGNFSNATPGATFKWVLGTDITLEFIMRRDSIDSGTRALMGCRTSTAADRQFGVYYLTGNQMLFDVGGTNARWSTGVNITDTNWHHIVFRHRGSDGFRDMWIDGAVINTTTVIPTTADATAGPLGIGGASGSTPFNGALDEVAIYNGALLPDARILAHWAEISPITMGGTAPMMGV